MFIQEVADNNTTITYADTLAVFSIMRSLLLKHMYAGDRVSLPSGSFFVTGSGTVELESDDFEPIVLDVDGNVLDTAVRSGTILGT